MNLAEIADQQQQVAALILRDAPEPWERLELQLAGAGGWSTFGCYAINGDQRELFEHDIPLNAGLDAGLDAGLAANELREVMYDPDTGTWLSMLCIIERDGSYHFTFNYDEPIDEERGGVEPETIEREFTDHPRPWHLIPEWTYVKQTFTEHEWDRRRKMLARRRARIRARQRQSDAIRTRLGLPLR